MHPDQENLPAADRKRPFDRRFIKEVALLVVVCAVWGLVFHFVFDGDRNPVTFALSGAVTVGVFIATRRTWGGHRERAGRRGKHAG